MEYFAWSVAAFAVAAWVFTYLELSAKQASVKWRDEWIDSMKESQDKTEDELEAVLAELEEARDQIIFLRNRIEMARDALKDPPP
jgi:predicted  nucleic acid-binding Zn-ribbon protein